MKLLISGGGTGGHIYPATALIKEMKQQSLIDDVLYVGSKRGIEKEIVAKENIQFIGLDIQGFKRSLSVDNFITLKKFFISVQKAKEIIKQFQPDVVVGTGGYASSAVVFAATLMHIPTLIQEQNSVAGITNKFLGKFVDRVTISYPEVANSFPINKVILTGNPRSQEVVNTKSSGEVDEFGFKKNRQTILIFGGSQGAFKINQVVKQLIQKLDKKYNVIFVTGPLYFDDIKADLTNYVLANTVVLPYVDNMPGLLVDVDLLISRSGATTIAEISGLGKASILIPSPNVTGNHQVKNAMSLVKQNAAEMILESDLSADSLEKAINNILASDDTLKAYETASAKIGHQHASDQIIDEIQKLIKKDK